MSSLTGSCPVLPPLTRTLTPDGPMVQRLGRSPPVDASGTLRLNPWDEETGVSSIRPNSSSNGLSKKLTSSQRTGSEASLTQYWSDRLNPYDRFRRSTVERTPRRSNARRMPSREEGMARRRHHMSTRFA